MDVQKHFHIASQLAHFLDAQFGVGKFKFGFDPLITAIPGIGDFIATSMAIYILWIGVQAKLPPEKIAQMLGNIFVNFLIGLVPAVGSFATIFYRSNIKNLAIIKHHLQSTGTVIEGEVVK